MNKKNSYMVLIMIIVFVLTLVGCKEEKKRGISSLSPERKTEITRTIVKWLECEECDDGELDELKKEGDLAVPTLIAALEKGPSPASLELLRLQLEERYSRLVKYAKSHPDMNLKQSKDEFVSHYLDNYIALCRIRAVEGLAAIGGKESAAALKRAGMTKYRSDVNSIIQGHIKK